MKSLALILACMGLATAAEAQSWGGAYIGGGLTYDLFDVEDLTYGSGPFEANGAGFLGFIGYNFQYGALVVGPELSLGFTTAEGNDGNYQLPFSATTTVGLHARVGYAMGNLLPYISVGYVSASLQSDHEGNNLPADFAYHSAANVAYTIGVDWAMGSNSFARIAYQHVDFDDYQFTYYGGDNHSMTTSRDQILVGYGMRF